MGKLHVGAADHLHRLHDTVRLLLQTLLAFLGDGQHGRGAERIARMHAERVDIFDKADRDNVVVRITHHLKLQFLPAENGFLHKHLPHKACLQSSGTDHLQLVLIVDKTASRAAHRVSWTQHHRVSQLFRNGKRLVHGVCHLAARHLNAQLVHGLFKFNAILAALNGVHLHADHLHVVLFQNTCLIQLCAQVQA